MNDAPSMPRPNACSTTPSNTGSPVLLLKLAINTDTGARGTLKHGLTLKDPVSGRSMEVWTTEAGMQMYTAEHWDGVFPGKHGPLKQYSAIAIEPQNFPDAPTHPDFPSAMLRPGEVYRQRMEWRFAK